MDPVTTSESRTVVYAPAASFLGSFAAESRQSHRIPTPGRGIKSLVQHYFTEGWDDIGLWKSAFTELVGTMSLCFLSALIHITIGSFNTTQVAGYIGVSNIVLLALLIYAIAPSSSGHINPVITFTTVTTALTGFSRGVLYIVGQIWGAAIAGGLIRGSFGEILTQHFLSFGVGFGPKLGPFLVACVLGLMSFATVGLAPGYPGAGMNPARCFSFAVARGEFRHQWIWWVGPLTGSLLHTAVYFAVPPYHREKRHEKKTSVPSIPLPGNF